MSVVPLLSTLADVSIPSKVMVLVADAPCTDTLNLVAAVRGAVAGLMDELVEEHLRCHVAAPELSPEQRAQGADELAVILRRYAN